MLRPLERSVVTLKSQERVIRGIPGFENRETWGTRHFRVGVQVLQILDTRGPVPVLRPLAAAGGICPAPRNGVSVVIGMRRTRNIDDRMHGKTKGKHRLRCCARLHLAAGDLPDAAPAIKAHSLCAPAGHLRRALLDILSKVSPGRVSSICLSTNR